MHKWKNRDANYEERIAGKFSNSFFKDYRFFLVFMKNLKFQAINMLSAKLGDNKYMCGDK